jgi:hypothetical protein
MLTAEQRRQRILANTESRLAKLRYINESEKSPTIPPMAPVSTPAPVELLQKSEEELRSFTTTSTTNNNPQQQQPVSLSSLFSTVTSATNMISSLTSASKPKSVPENTKEMVIMDKQYISVIILGVIIGILYAFYLSSQSNFFFIMYFTCCLCILTSRYYFMKMKHRTNVLISTLVLSGFKPELVKQLVLVYTLAFDAWVIFAVYFVSFCLTHVLCSLFKNE